MFLYQGNLYDAENPWKGLFRSSILISVSSFPFFGDTVASWISHTGLQTRFHVTKLCWKGVKGYSLRKCPYPWHDSRDTCVDRLYRYSGMTFLPICLWMLRYLAGSVRTLIITRVLANGYGNRLRAVLHQCSRSLWRRRRERRGQWSYGVVESVSHLLSMQHRAERCVVGYFLHHRRPSAPLPRTARLRGLRRKGQRQRLQRWQWRSVIRFIYYSIMQYIYGQMQPLLKVVGNQLQVL